MNYITEFYKGLDTFNLIIFWGIIIVVTLLLIFSIILVDKNKKLRIMLEERQAKKMNNNNNDIPIYNVNNQIEQFKEEENISKNISDINQNIDIDNQELNNNNVIIKEPEEKNISKNISDINQSIDIDNQELNNNKQTNSNKFIAEEYVIDYNLNNQQLSVKEKEIVESKKESENITSLKGPYQKNILRDMSLHQTSPIGINYPTKNIEENINKANELYESFKKNSDNSSIENTQKIAKNSDYLNEVSEKLTKAKNESNIDRTAYEIMQEEEAIISYDELMRKKDTIKIIDEEDAVISIEELMKNTNKQEKLYNITSKEGNETFINELKKFRKDL